MERKKERKRQTFEEGKKRRKKRRKKKNNRKIDEMDYFSVFFLVHCCPMFCSGPFPFFLFLLREWEQKEKMMISMEINLDLFFK